MIVVSAVMIMEIAVVNAVTAIMIPVSNIMIVVITVMIMLSMTAMAPTAIMIPVIMVTIMVTAIMNTVDDNYTDCGHSCHDYGEHEHARRSWFWRAC